MGGHPGGLSTAVSGRPAPTTSLRPIAAGRLDVLRFEPCAPARPSGGETVVVLDTTWTARPDDTANGVIGLRDIAERVLGRRDLIAETAERLDAWADRSGVIDLLTADDTSFWFYFRLRHWVWLQQQILWLWILDELVEELHPAMIRCATDVDPDLVAASRLVAARDGLGFRAAVDGADAAGLARSHPPAASTPAFDPVPPAASPPAPEAVPAAPSRWRRPRGTQGRSGRWLELGIRRVRRGLVARIGRSDEPTRRRRVIRKRLATLGRGPRRLLVVLEHARQRVETPTGPRLMNPYLGPIVDRLRRTRLDPIEIDIRAKLGDDNTWERLIERGGDRLLPSDAIWLSGAPWPPDRFQRRADEAADTLLGTTSPSVEVCGIDLGPVLTSRVAEETRRAFGNQLRGVDRIRTFLRRIRPAGLLLADEYHRQEWLAAARAERVPTVAVQHGMIYRWHNGYIHRSRPRSLRLADRLYVFGQWERDLLVTSSVYREDEVRVGGSPRLDLVRPESVDREAVREQLGVAPGDRMVVVSGTWGTIYRRFHYPISLAALVDRPLPRVHLVVKLHPGEPDEGPYRRVIEGACAARGIEPPPITIVQSIDLYQLLAAADAHVGIHSTVLTEAVAAGTPNLLVDTLAAADLLGYVPAEVAIPVRDGGDLLAALDAAQIDATQAGAAEAEENRRRFIAAHFEPGSASDRIATDLLAWLP